MVRMPCSFCFLAAFSAATCAAYGVDLREPLNPIVPADDQAIVLPCASVMVIIVLLNVAFTCATPDAMFLRSRLRTRVASLPILDSFRGPAPIRRSPYPVSDRSEIDIQCARRRPAGSGDAATPGSSQGP